MPIIISEASRSIDSRCSKSGEYNLDRFRNGVKESLSNQMESTVNRESDIFMERL